MVSVLVNFLHDGISLGPLFPHLRNKRTGPHTPEAPASSVLSHFYAFHQLFTELSKVPLALTQGYPGKASHRLGHRAPLRISMKELGTSASLQWPPWTECGGQTSLTVRLTTAKLLLGRAGEEEHAKDMLVRHFITRTKRHEERGI